MKIIINGKEIEIKEELTISELLGMQNIKILEMVVVEVNGRILKRREFESTILNEDDKIEFLYYMGGGII